MMNRTFSTMMASAVVLGSLMVGCSGGGQGRPQLTLGDSPSLAPKIERMLAEKDYASALSAAEQLVARESHNGEARAILGRAYLANGRYVSARTAFSDAMTLGNRDPRTIISLALSESGLGDVEGARTLLSNHIADLPAGDYGLAMAMAGDPQEGVRALLEAVHAPEATVKTRQNLAYALAMAGAWGQARLIAGQDLPAKDAEARIGEWTRAFAQGSPSDRVIAMLGVAPRSDDAGLPIQLALNAAPEQPVQLASAADVVSAPVTAVTHVDVAEPVVTPAASPVVVATASPAAKPVFGPEALAAILARAPAAMAPKADVALEPVELPSGVKPAPTPVPAVQTVPAVAPIERLKAAFMQAPESAGAGPKPARGPMQTAPKPAFVQPAAAKPAVHAEWTSGLGKPAPAAKTSNWVVQVGAFDSATLAREQWRRLASNRATLKDYSAVHSTLALNGRTFYRLAIRGFEDRGAAANACGALKTAGQDCFVRLDDKARQVAAGQTAGRGPAHRAEAAKAQS